MCIYMRISSEHLIITSLSRRHTLSPRLQHYDSPPDRQNPTQLTPFLRQLQKRARPPEAMTVQREETRTLAVLDVERGPEQEVQGTPSCRWRWASGLLAVALCVSASILLTWTMQNRDQSEGGNDLPVTLRQLAGIEKPAIHVVGEYRDGFPSVYWNVHSDHSFSQGHLDLIANEIVIPDAGLYFVYSQASFDLACGGAGPKLVSHGLERWSDSYGAVWKPLLSTMRSACEGGSRSLSGIYLGAIFSLKKGDKVRTYIQASLLKSLEDGDGKTFFGAFAL